MRALLHRSGRQALAFTNNGFITLKGDESDLSEIDFLTPADLWPSPWQPLNLFLLTHPPQGTSKKRKWWARYSPLSSDCHSPDVLLDGTCYAPPEFTSWLLILSAIFTVTLVWPMGHNSWNCHSPGVHLYVSNDCHVPWKQEAGCLTKCCHFPNTTSASTFNLPFPDSVVTVYWELIMPGVP